MVLVVAAVAGWVHADAWARDRARDCRLLLAEGDRLAVEGVVSGAWGRGPVVAVRSGLPGGCVAELRVSDPDRSGAVALGRTVRVEGLWRSWTMPGRAPDPELAGELRGALRPAPVHDVPGWGLARWRETVRGRLVSLFPERHGLVAALVLARRDGVEPDLRDRFTAAGVAHLLAISGFHVGVIAVLILGLLRAVGVRKRPATVAGTLGVWAYVAFIGAPDAAVRAALLLGLVAAGILRGRPVHAAGALAAALLLFTAVDPGAPGRAGFQLSFLGAAGLVFLAPVVDRALERRGRWRRLPSLRTAVAVGVAATLATLPAVAWHFERVSLVGIPVTLVATPVVAVALPGVLAAVVVDALPLLPDAVGDFLAGGADLLLAGLVDVVRLAGEQPWATVAVPRTLVAGTVLGGILGAVLLPPPRRVGRDVRVGVALAGAVAAGVVAAPLGSAAGTGALEIVALDVGQGDAVAIRSPRGRWLLVDAGPGPPRGRPGEPRVVARLRARGVARLEGLVLTHPDLDHIGGAGAVVEGFRPRFVAGPGHPRGTDAYREGLDAESRGVRPPRVVLRAGERLDFDGVTLRVLHPSVAPSTADEPNASSVVLHLRYGAFTALLTGDAPAAVEEGLAARAGDVDLLKVSHHGSLTSTSAAFLDVVRPEVALVSAGRRNRFGHPHPAVLGRLAERGATVLRTDRTGDVRIVARADGRWWSEGADDTR